MKEQLKQRFADQVFNFFRQHPTGTVPVYADVPYNGLSVFEIEAVLISME